MSTKSVSFNRDERTQLTGEFLNGLRNVDTLKLAPSTGSTNRLIRYQKNLARSQGVGKPLFDDQVVDLLRQYVYDKHQFDEVIQYLNSLKDDDGHLFSRNLKIYSKISDAMARFAENDHTSFRWNQNYAKALKDLKDDLSTFRLTPERYESDDDILHALPKVNTHSGYYFIEYGVRKKGDCIEGLYAKLKRRKESIRRGDYQKFPILLGFRTQASGEFDDDGSQTGKCKHKTRVVSMYDLRDICLELQFSNPIQISLNKTFFYAGGKNDNKINMIITHYRRDFSKFMSIDYSSFDQTISSWLIEDAFDVLHSMFALTEGQEMEWQAVVDNFIHKRFVLTEGVLESHKGVPSGSMFTQIIDSIVNVLVVKTFFNSIGKKCRMIAMGDDNAIFCDGDVDIEHLASYVMKNFGLIVKVDEKSNEGDTKRDNVKFLSKYWTDHGPWRHPNQLISRLAFPERFRDYSGIVKPQHVIYSYMLAYPSGMRKLMNVGKFVKDFQISAESINFVDSRYVPGSLAYIKEYTIM